MVELNAWEYEFMGFKNIPSYCDELLEKYENLIEENPEEKEFLTWVIDNIKFSKQTFNEMFGDDLKKY